MRHWRWLSFCNAERPKGTQFLGACLVDVDTDPADVRGSVKAAIDRAWMLGLNPGGEVMTYGPIPEEAIPAGFPRLTLMSRADIDANGGGVKG